MAFEDEEKVANQVQYGAALDSAELRIYTHETLIQRTKNEILRLSAELADKNELLTLLEKNPETERIMTLLSRKLY